jgi:hypothetical protein
MELKMIERYRPKVLEANEPFVEQRVNDQLEKSPMTAKTDLSNSVGGIQPASKSRSRRKTARRAHNGRRWLNDMFVRVLEFKHPNAVKHGVFSDNPAVRGENSHEFDELVSALINEWRPSGPTEEEAVYSIAHDMWRKRRAQRFLQAQLFVNTFDQSHPSFAEVGGLLNFYRIMLSEPETAFEKEASRFLRPDTIYHLKQKFPRSKYKSASEWGEAVATEIKTVLLPSNYCWLSQPEDEIEAAVRGEAIKMKETASVSASSELFEQELALHERLDAKIARKIKFLIETKAMKQMLRQAGAVEQAGEQQRKIAYGTPNQTS